MSPVSPHRALLATTLVAAAATLAISGLSFVEFAYRSPESHVALETAAGLVCLLACWLMLGRFRRSHQLADLVASLGLGVLAFANLAFLVIPATIERNRAEGLEVWAPVGAGTVGAVIFAAAAFTPQRRIVHRDVAIRRGVAAILAVFLVIAAAAALFSESLQSGIDPLLSPEGANRPRIVGDPWLLTLQLVAMAAYAVAALGFLRRATTTNDELMAWFAVGAVLAAFGRLNYFLFPSRFSEWVYTGDVFRLLFFVVLLIGAAREIAAYQRGLAAAAADDERRRVARDLHDGLAQELTFVVTESRRLADHQPVDLRQLTSAAERALDESRNAITALASGPDRPLAEELAQAAEDVAARAGARMRLRLDDHADAPTAIRQALARVVREAVTNAVRHGGASEVTLALDLRGDGRLHVSVHDDGPGFDRATDNGNGFGLPGMRDRVEELGGDFHVESRPGEGTLVEVDLP